MVELGKSQRVTYQVLAIELQGSRGYIFDGRRQALRQLRDPKGQHVSTVGQSQDGKAALREGFLLQLQSQTVVGPDQIHFLHPEHVSPDR